MTPETFEALRAVDDRAFLESFSDAMRTEKLSQDDLGIFVDELHRRADKNRAALAERDTRNRAALALAKAPAASDARN